jgi:signal peptidase I
MRAQPAGPRGRLLGAAGFLADTYLWAILSLLVWVAVPAVILGWTPTVISSGSMGPVIDPGDVVLIERDLDPEHVYGPGTIVTFGHRDDPQRWVTHRIVDVDDERRYVTRGDANAVDDAHAVERDQVVGVGRLVVPLIGRPVVWHHEGARTAVAVLLWATAIAAWVSTRPIPVLVPVPVPAPEPLRERQPFRLPAMPRTDRPLGGGVAPRRARPGGRPVRPQHVTLRPLSPRRARGWAPHPERAVAGLALLAVVAVGATVPLSSASFAASTANAGNSFATAPVAGPPVVLVLPPRNGQDVIPSRQQNVTATFAFPVEQGFSISGTVTAAFEVRSSTPGNPGRDLAVELRLDGQTLASGSVELRDRSQQWYPVEFDLAPPLAVTVPAGSTLEVVVTFRRHDLRLTGGSLLTLPT